MNEKKKANSRARKSGVKEIYLNTILSKKQKKRIVKQAKKFKEIGTPSGSSNKELSFSTRSSYISL